MNCPDPEELVPNPFVDGNEPSGVGNLDEVLAVRCASL